MRVKREALLQELESVQPGLSQRDIVEQSSCFVFQNGQVLTFNDEIACAHKTCLTKLTGAVRAGPLMSMLRKLGEDELDVDPYEGELILRGKGRKFGVTMENEILLKIHAVEPPGEFKKLPEDFSEAITLVHQCAHNDQTKGKITCVHIHPKWMEALDNDQLIRYKLKTGVPFPLLIRKDSVKHVPALGMTEMAVGETWCHFRNSSGLVLSCRRYLDDFPDINTYLDVAGVATTLPKGLGEATDKAEVFSAENQDNNQVLVELRPGKLRVMGQGVSGWYSEVKQLKYTGEALSFLIAPKLLMEIIKRHNDVEIAPERLKVDGGKFIYVTCLGVAGEEKNGEAAEPADD